jgi:hypothetical protein
MESKQSNYECINGCKIEIYKKLIHSVRNSKVFDIKQLEAINDLCWEHRLEILKSFNSVVENFVYYFDSQNISGEKSI